jgi:hypothetical protein
MGTFQIKRLLWLAVVVLFSCGLVACGSTSKGATPPSQVPDTKSSGTASAEHTNINTGKAVAAPSPEQKAKTPLDNAARNVLNLGHAANATDKGLIAALVRRYYKAEADEDGAAACSMLYSLYAESVPEDYGVTPPGPTYAHGTTCPAVMTLVFKHFHNQIVARLPKLEISRVRLIAHQGVAVLSFGGRPEREIHVTREGHIWRIVGLTDSELP